MTDQAEKKVESKSVTDEHYRRHRMENMGLLLRTVGHLRPAQIGHRVRLRAQRLIDPWWPHPPAALWPLSNGIVPGWPVGFIPLDACLDAPDAASVSEGRFSFMGEERLLGDPADWNQDQAPRLWRFYLHYFEWAWSLAHMDDRERAGRTFALLWRSWTDHVNFSNDDAWSPYVASLRAWTLCGIYPTLIKGSDIAQDVINEMRRHACFVRTHLELDVGGNHLLKNLKALIGLGVFLGRSELVASGRRHLDRQLPIQVLADGGHFERSASYHCQVLGDLIDIRALLAMAGEQPVRGLDHAIGNMRSWLGAMLGADGEIPMCNDAIPVGSRQLAALEPTPSPSGRVVLLPASGYVVIRPDDRSQIVLDIGDPCPDELPAHAHADCLSFEVWIDGRRVVADTGTSTYEPGSRRNYERSTAAHNTVELDGTNQTEVWGAFRAALRARGTLEVLSEDGNVVTVVASHNGYRRLPGAPTHRRRWTISPGQITIDDELGGTGRHSISSRLHFADGERSAMTIEASGGRVSIDQSLTAWGFGNLLPAETWTLDVQQVQLPHSLTCSLKWI